MKKLWKKALGRVFALFYLMWCGSMRFVFVTPYMEKRVVLGNWHQELLMDIYWGRLLKKKERLFVALVSLHGDGEYAELGARACHLEVVRGSTRRTEGNLYRNMLKIFKNDYIPVFTLDGPLGPYHKIHTGALVFAKRNKLPIQIIFSYPHRAILFRKAWDRFLLPLPFTRVDCFVSEPFLYDLALDLEANRVRLQEFSFQERVRFLKQIQKIEQLEKFIGPDEKKLFETFNAAPSLPPSHKDV